VLAASRRGLWSEQVEEERPIYWEEKKRSSMESPPFPNDHTTVPWDEMSKLVCLMKMD
jgi:hypothetical protein